ncbi:MAG: HD domain-containing phosphohydrolase [Thermodesulfobacteriota bacterium]
MRIPEYEIHNESIKFQINGNGKEKMEEEKVRILVVEDESPIRNLLKRLLETNDYQCTLAANAEEAREFLKKSHFELILSDQVMPGETGLEFLKYALPNYPETRAIMVSVMDSPGIAKEAMELGVYGYIIKPFEANELLISVENALRRRQSEINERCLRENLEQMVQERTRELQEALKKLRKSMDGIIQAVAMTVESRDPYTAGHQKRVANLAYIIASEMRLQEDKLEGTRMAGTIHDLGKVSVPSEILSKPGSLNEIEFGLIKGHALVGYNILKDIDFPWPMAQIVFQHHERINGSGYPQGLSGEGILMEAKILGVADVVEAMASHRPYRPALGTDKALEEISRNKGILYDADVADACLKVFTEKGFKFSFDSL